MQGVRIRDLVESKKYLAVDLHHILDLLGDRALQSRWRASEVWATAKDGSAAAVELEKLADGLAFIAGEHLSRLAHGVVQVIDGEFAGFERDGNSAWVIIQAVDSSFYEVFSPEAAVLEKVRTSFRQVSDCDYIK